MFNIIIMFSFILIAVPSVKANTADWSKDATLPGTQYCFDSHGHEVCLRDGNRSDIYQQGEESLKGAIKRGSKHALSYPVESTDLQLPKKAMDKFFNSDSRSVIRRFIFKIAKKLSNFKSESHLFSWLGLHDYPKKESQVGPNYIAEMGELEKYPMGVTVFNPHSKSPAMSFSCVACHSGNLFGVKVLGMTNRFPRANEIFILGQKALTKSNPFLFNLMIGPSDEDMLIYKKSREAIQYVKVKAPLTLGLDTSVAQVGLSLTMRADDEYSTKIPGQKARPSMLNTQPADSKPAVWWNLKYKTKWLSDGGIISGNPVHTNFIWNEVGRGADLKVLEKWLDDNLDKVHDLTAYAFSTKAPEFNNFFPRKINIKKAKRGEKLFLQSCKGCHGIYDKGWSGSTEKELTYEEKISTTKVWYHEKTPVVDVGTDPYRRIGMKYLAKEFNRLKLAKDLETQVYPQKGYVPQPLVGIWARWPYFHNNSAPSLYAVLTPAPKRPKTYIAVPADSKTVDFDFEKNGYPAPHLIRKEYREDEDYFFDTTRKGMSNMGHTEMMLNEDGTDKFNHQEKLEIIEFLKTL